MTGSGNELEQTCAIIPTDPNAEVAAIHDRIPLLVEPAELQIWPVGYAVTSSRSNNPDRIAGAIGSVAELARQLAA